jgi:hypothetical protein
VQAFLDILPEKFGKEFLIQVTASFLDNFNLENFLVDDIMKNLIANH